jgi:hypothetical protein
VAREERGCRSRRIGSRFVIESGRRCSAKRHRSGAGSDAGQSTSIPAPSGSTQSTTSGQTGPGTTTGQNTPNTAPGAGMPSRPGCGAGSTVGSTATPGAGSPTGTTPPGGTGSPPLINDPSVGTSQTTTQNQLKGNPMAVPNTGGVGTGC